jgi:hypothetical protein
VRGAGLRYGSCCCESIEVKVLCGMDGIGVSGC